LGQQWTEIKYCNIIPSVEYMFDDRMKVLTKAECQQWCERHGVPVPETTVPVFPPDSKEFSIPSDAGRRVALTQEHLSVFQDASEILVWMTEWNVWPSGERMHMFERFRSSYGVSTPLIEHPGHLLSRQEFETTGSLVAFAILFLWDCYVVASDRRAMLFYSHDEFGRLSANSVEQISGANAG
jgi:hypothetical protein